MKRIIFALLLTASALLKAADQKIAVIDMEKTFTEYYKTKISDANLNKQAEIFRSYADKLKKSYLKLDEEYRNLRDGSLNAALSATERESKRLSAQEKYRQLMAKKTELQQYDKEKQTHLKQEYERMRERLLGEIKKEIKRRCAIEGYSIVFDKSGKTLNNIPVVVINSAVMDITRKVLKDLNRGHKEPLKANSKGK